MVRCNFIKILIVLTAISLTTDAEEYSYSACNIRFGYLTYERGNFAFSSNGKKEIYDPSLVDGNSLPLMEELPGYREIGIRSETGEELLFKGPRADFLRFLPEKYPKFTITTYIFESKKDRSRLEVNARGKTPVIRIDIDLEGESKQDGNVFWKVISSEDLSRMRALGEGN